MTILINFPNNGIEKSPKCVFIIFIKILKCNGILTIFNDFIL